MGIKDLWTILTPFCERKPLFELQGKTVAIDLSGWVCQAQCITEYQVQPKMYLRNLYFRTCYLLMLGVNPVFVLEGAAPTLKHKTIQSRNAIQFKGAKPRINSAKEAPAKGRTRFHHVLKQCEEMLRLMGLSCVTAVGEAEAMCAYLNEEMMVDGCISQDSDCFAYGAKIVYRNFSISQQGVSAASGGSVDVYDLHKAERAMDFGRQKVIALSLICGSDYNEGVFGVGKEAAMKLFSTIPNEDILSRIRSWRSKEVYYEKLTRDTDIKNNCSQCGHSGNKAKHTRSGCIQCGTVKHCKDLTETNKINEIRNELNIRKKALENPGFPDENLISEFLIRKDNVSHLNLQWKKPDMSNFIKFTVKNLQWEDVYCFEKLFPILTRWCVLNPDQAPIKPKYIKKIRNPKGVISFEIIWDCDCFKIYLQEEMDEAKLFSSLEPQDLIQRNYPELVEAFNESRIKPKSKKKKGNKETKIGENSILKKSRKKVLKEKDENISVNLDNEFVNKNNHALIKKTKKKDDISKQPTLTQMLKINENQDEFDAIRKDKQPIKLNLKTNHPLKKSGFNANLDDSCFGDEDDDANLSLVIGGIISQGVPDLVKEKIAEFKNKSNDEMKIGKNNFEMSSESDLKIYDYLEKNERKYEKEITCKNNMIDGIYNKKYRTNNYMNNKYFDYDLQEVTSENQLKARDDLSRYAENNDYCEENKVKYAYEFKDNVKSNESLVNDEMEEFEEDVRETDISHFFGDVTFGEPDLFEKTFNAVTIASSSESDDSFDEEYIPLLERLQKKM